MIQVIAGNKGTGKTKRLIEMTNAAVASENGQIVFVDNDKSYMYDLKHEVRFVDAGEYSGVNGKGVEVFLGFLSGMLAGNFDISLVCIDAFKKLTKIETLNGTENFFKRLAELSEKSNCNFVINISGDVADLPAYVAQYVI